MVRSSSHTRRSNAEPAASSGRSKLVRVPSKYSVSCWRTRASNPPAGPRPSSSAHPASGAERLRPTGKNTPLRAVSEAVSTSSPMGLGKRAKVSGMGSDPKASASLGRQCKEPSGKPDGSHYDRRTTPASGTDRARGGPDDDLAGGRRGTADHLAGERIHRAAHDALQVHVDHVYRHAAARHTVTGGDLLVQHHIADPGQADVRIRSHRLIAGERLAGHCEVRERRAGGVAERTALAGTAHDVGDHFISRDQSVHDVHSCNASWYAGS